MSLLTVVQEFCRRTGLSVPTSVVGDSDTQTQQLLGLVNELVGEITLVPYSFTALQREATFTTVSGADQGALSTLADDGYKSIIPDSMYNRTQNLPILGPILSDEWQRLQSMGMTGTNYYFRERLGHLWFNPDATAGDTVAFEYRSTYAVVAADGTTYKATFTVDTDTFLLPESLLTLGLRWKWREEKGLDYGSLRESFERQLYTYKAEDGTKSRIDLSGESRKLSTGIIVPVGSYNQ